MVEDWKALAEERGREIERLRAELEQARDTNNDLTVRGGSANRRACEAEARLREVEKAARAVLLDDLFPLEDTPMPPLDEISRRQDALRTVLAAAKPEEKSR